jgi:hypothetical protein
MSFFPERREVDDVPLEMHNKVVEQLAAVEAELQRCRQKVAHLIRENEELKAK